MLTNTPMYSKSTRLAQIALRHRRNPVRDAVFAAFVALAAFVSVSSISTAAAAASTQLSR